MVVVLSEPHCTMLNRANVWCMYLPKQNNAFLDSTLLLIKHSQCNSEDGFCEKNDIFFIYRLVVAKLFKLIGQYKTRNQNHSLDNRSWTVTHASGGARACQYVTLKTTPVLKPVVTCYIRHKHLKSQSTSVWSTTEVSASNQCT